MRESFRYIMRAIFQISFELIHKLCMKAYV
jgi:hypothetical protein